MKHTVLNHFVIITVAVASSSVAAITDGISPDEKVVVKIFGQAPKRGDRFAKSTTTAPDAAKDLYGVFDSRSIPIFSNAELMSNVFERYIEALWWCRLLGVSVTNGCNVAKEDTPFEVRIEFRDLILTRHDLEKNISSLMPSLVSNDVIYASLDLIHEQTNDIWSWGLGAILYPFSMETIRLSDNGIMNRPEGDLVYNMKCQVAYQIAIAHSKSLLYEIILKNLMHDNTVVEFERGFIECNYTDDPTFYLSMDKFDKTLLGFHAQWFTGGSKVKDNIDALTNTTAVIKSLQNDFPHGVELSVLSHIRRSVYYSVQSERWINTAKREALLSDEEIGNILKLF